MELAELVMTVEEMKDRKAWLELRNSGLGGSDAATLVGKNPWKSKLALWAEKSGQTKPEDLSGNQRVYWGQKNEANIAEWFCEVTGKQVRRRGMMRSCEFPWMLASMDREVIGEKAGLEIKTAGVDQAKYWTEDEIPDMYYLQCQWYMAVTGYDRWYIAVLIGGNDARWNVVERNQEQIDQLIAAGKEFWQMVQDLIPPAPDGSESAKDTLQEMYPGGKTEPVEITDPEAVMILDRYYHYAAREAKYKEAKDAAANELRNLLADNEEAKINGVKVTWKTQAGRVTVDDKALKKDLPDVYEKYKKTGKPFRVLKVGKNNKG